MNFTCKITDNTEKEITETLIDDSSPRKYRIAAEFLWSGDNLIVSLAITNVRYISAEIRHQHMYYDDIDEYKVQRIQF